MIYKNNSIKLLLVLSISLLCNISHAGVIRFHNGDILHGKIIKITAETVTVNPDFQPDLTLELTSEKIKTFTTDAEFTLEFQEEDTPPLRGAVTLHEDKSLSITDHDQKLEIANVKEAYHESFDERHSFKYRGNVRSGLNAVSGNNNSKAYDLSGLFVAEDDDQRFTTNLEYGFSQESNTTTRDRTFGRFKYDHFISENFYTFLNTDFERDVLRDLNLRSAVGLGMGYRLYNQEDHRLDFEIAPNFVREDFDTTPSQDNNFAALRWSMNYNQTFWEKLEVFHNHRALQSLADNKDIVINARSGFNIPIIDNFQAGFEWRLDWNNNPTDGNKPTDHSFIANLGYSFE